MATGLLGKRMQVHVKCCIVCMVGWTHTQSSTYMKHDDVQAAIRAFPSQRRTGLLAQRTRHNPIHPWGAVKAPHTATAASQPWDTPVSV